MRHPPDTSVTRPERRTPVQAELSPYVVYTDGITDQSNLLARMKASLKLLKTNRVARVWYIATMQSWIGTGAAWPALALLAAARWHSPWAISLVLAADFVPIVLFGAFAGALADKYSRRTLMSAAEAVSAVAMAGAFLTHSYAMLLAFSTLAGCGRAVYSPASKAVIGQLGSKEEVPVFSAMRSSCQAFGFTLGPALAGVLLLWLSAKWLLAFDSVTYFVEAALLMTLPALRPTPSSSAANDEGGGVYSSSGRALIEGVRALKAYRVALVVVFVLTCGELFGPVLNVALVPFAKGLLHAGNASVGLLATVTGVGLILASAAMARPMSQRNLARVYAFGWAGYGISLIVMVHAPVLIVALLAKNVQGAANAATMSAETSLINTNIPERLTGRVFGLLDAVASSGFALSFLLAGSLLSATGVVFSLTLAGAGCVLAGVIAGVGLLPKGVLTDKPESEAAAPPQAAVLAEDLAQTVL